jgi:hypothetical protein
MRKFWQDVKRTLKLYLTVLVPGTAIAVVVGLATDEEIGNITAVIAGIIGGLYIVYYEHKHDVWRRNK